MDGVPARIESGLSRRRSERRGGRSILRPVIPVPGDVLLGKLRVLGRLGEGGMGVVLEVEHTLTKHRRALKLLRPEVAADPDVAARFLREAGVAGQIGSRYVAEVQDAGRLEDGSLYVLMERLEGESLGALLRRRGALRPGEAVEIARQLCEGLEAAHGEGIVHRDLKPENVFLVAGEDGRSQVKILDFGISKFESADGWTRSGHVLGTPLYMAPEQLRDAKRATATADLYSVGVILYELLSGARPYDAENLTELIVKVLERDHRPIDAMVPGLDPRLAALVERCMAATPEARFASARALADALADLPGEPIGAPSASSSSTTLAFAPTVASAPRVEPVAPAPASEPPTPPPRRGVLYGLGAAAVVAAGVAAIAALPDTPTPSPADAPRAAAEPSAVDGDPPAAEPPHIEAPAVGYLTLTTAPSTTASLGGRSLGATPLERVALPPGTHALRLVDEARGIDRELEVEIRAGQTTEHRVELEAPPPSSHPPRAAVEPDTNAHRDGLSGSL